MGAAKKKEDKRAKHNRGECHTEGCDREAEISGLCKPCYQVDYYWRCKTPAERRQRVKNLKLYQNRMEAVSPPKLRRVK